MVERPLDHERAVESTVMTEAEARAVTNRIRQTVSVAIEQIKKAYEGRAWIALGYESWTDYYCSTEFGKHIRLPRDERQHAVAVLRRAETSVRAIAVATGASKSTIADDLSGVQNRTTDDDVIVDAEIVDDAQAPTPTITGTDGKKYAATSAKRADRHPIHKGKRRINPRRVVEQSVVTVSGLGMGLDLLPDDLDLRGVFDRETRRALAAELDEALPKLRRLSRALHRDDVEVMS
jgi:hypothetical protein